MEYAYEKLLPAVYALASPKPMLERLKYAFTHLVPLNEDDFDQDLRDRWAQIKSAEERVSQMNPDDLTALAESIVALFAAAVARDQLSQEISRDELQRALTRRRSAKAVEAVSAVVLLKRRGGERFEGAGRHHFPRPSAIR